MSGRDPRELETLHQKASGHYLQGDYDNARKTWQQLLELHDTDERAFEGIRRCDEAEAVPSPDDDVLEIDASADLDGEVDAAFGFAMPEPDPEPEAAPAATNDAVAAAPAAMWNWQAGVDDANLTTSPADRDSPAMALRRRANELLAESLVSMEQGQDREALATLDKLLTIDPDNDAGRSLREKVCTGLGIDPNIADRPVEDPQQHWDGQSPDLGTGSTIGLSQTPVEDEAAPVPDLEGSLLDDAEFAPPDFQVEVEPGGMPEATADDDDAVVAVAPPPPSSRLKWIGLAVAVAGLGFLGWQQFLSPGPEPEPVDQAEVVTPLDEFLAEPPPDESTTDVTPAVHDVVPVDVGEQLTTLLGRARQAFREGQYEAAILAFNEALQVAPQNGEAHEGLRAAGERYRVQREYDQRWEDAKRTFNQQDYHGALRMFYRVPTGEREPQVTRYKANGWYNAGLQRLQAGACDEALDHFSDALELMPDDARNSDAVSMAKRCAKDRSSTFLAHVTRMQLRKLDD